MRPTVGLTAASMFWLAGLRIDPEVSVPTFAAQKLAAVPIPELDPPVRSCQLDTNIHLWRITAHNAVHRCEVAEMLKPPPHDFRAGAVAPTAPHKPAELGDPGDGLA